MGKLYFMSAPAQRTRSLADLNPALLRGWRRRRPSRILAALQALVGGLGRLLDVRGRG